MLTIVRKYKIDYHNSLPGHVTEMTTTRQTAMMDGCCEGRQLTSLSCVANSGVLQKVYSCTNLDKQYNVAIIAIIVTNKDSFT